MGIFKWLKRALTYDPSVYKPPVDTTKDSGPSMNEGDFRSGPEGYSPNTAYPEAFYPFGESTENDQNEGDQTR